MVCKKLHRLYLIGGVILTLLLVFSGAVLAADVKEVGEGSTVYLRVTLKDHSNQAIVGAEVSLVAKDPEGEDTADAFEAVQRDACPNPDEAPEGEEQVPDAGTTDSLGRAYFKMTVATEASKNFIVTATGKLEGEDLAGSVSQEFTVVGSFSGPPTITSDPASGPFVDEVTVTIAPPEGHQEADIYYTTDGSDPLADGAPSANAILYAGPFKITRDEPETVTVKARAFQAGYFPSNVAEASFTIAPTLTWPSTVFVPDGRTVSVREQAQTIKVTLNLPQKKDDTVKIYYTTDGTTPTSASAEYTSEIEITRAQGEEGTVTIKVIAVGEGWTDSPVVVSKPYKFTNNAVLPEPIFTPSAGTYSTEVSVTISYGTLPAGISASEVKIRFTEDGTEPTEASPECTAPIVIPATAPLEKTIKAFVWTAKEGFDNSDVVEAVYVIKPLLAAPVITPDGGDFTSAQSVSISAADPQAEIYYTIGYDEMPADPTASSTKYTGAFTIPAQGQWAEVVYVKAIAIREDYTNSPVTMATFNFEAPSEFKAIFRKNPFSAGQENKLQVSLSKNADVTLRIWNTRGTKIVREIEVPGVSKGISEPITWDGTDDNGRKLARGFYIYQVIAVSGSEEEKAVGLIYLQ